jgi:glycerol-3-phosphate acyltransferase PlsY
MTTVYETLAPVTEAVTDAVTDAVVSEGVTFSEFLYKGWLGILGERGSLPHVAIYFAVIVLCALLGYFLGSVNFAVVISRLKFHDDVRNHGSGNAGATNMMRTYGKAAGIATLAGDILKGVVAVMIARFLVGEVWAYMTGMFCVIGHAYPCYYRFKGGKGVAVTAAIALTLEPLAFLLIFSVFAIIVGFTKYVSLGSIMAALMYPLFLNNILESRFGHADLRMLFVFVICILVIWLHRENIKRLQEGRENKISFKKDKKQFPHYPEFFVVMTPQHLVYGCGYYWMMPETVKAMRELIESNHPAWQKALKAYENQDVFTLEDDKYKRSKYPAYPENIRNWLDSRNICCVKETTDFDLVFSDKLGRKLCEDLKLMKDVYDFLVVCENHARGIIKYN